LQFRGGQGDKGIVHYSLVGELLCLTYDSAAMADSQEKRKQVAQLYAGMSDVELKRLADSAWSLTETGKEVLRAELDRRELKFELATAAAEPPEDPSTSVVLRKFRDLPEALLAKGALESAGLESFLIDESVIRMDWLWSDLLGGVKLCVKREDAETAAQLLDKEIPEQFSFEGDEDFEQPRCPQCQSLTITYEDLNKPATYATAFVLGLPIYIPCRRWNCQNCGYIWDQTDESSKETK